MLMPAMRTREWLVEARRRAGISQTDLLELVGLKSIIAISQYENGTRTPSAGTWQKIEDALRPLAPMMVVEVDALIADVEAGMRWEKEDALCRLSYASARMGLIFTSVSSLQREDPADPFITVSFKDALGLLEAQRSLLIAEQAESAAECLDEDIVGLKQAREALGLSQRKTAALLGISQSKLSLLEAGKIKEPELVERCLRELNEATRLTRGKKEARRQF